MDNISPTLLWEIFKHVRSWLANLNRAGWQRKQQSKQALQNVILAARETAVYLRQFKDTGKPNHRTERHLAMLWTKLGFELKEKGLDKLTKRCHISGGHWADPEFYDADPERDKPGPSGRGRIVRAA
ncbi:MAG: hypothetical protein VYB22_04640 [Pseudomonadota bacterium]|nr:hypothetical protein [Pseudomonadota bacterium]